MWAGQFSSHGAYTIFLNAGPKVSLSLPAQKRECDIFRRGLAKNSIGEARAR